MRNSKDIVPIKFILLLGKLFLYMVVINVRVPFVAKLE